MLDSNSLLHAKHLGKAGPSVGTGSCNLLNAPENTEAALQIPLTQSASENPPKAM